MNKYVEMTCRLCKEPFLRHKDHPYKKNCTLCWKKEKNINLNDIDETILFYRSEIKSYEKQLNQIKEENIKLRSLIKRLKSNKIKNKKDESIKLDSSIIKNLLFLCHPDKHNNSKRSIEATQWILEQRK